MKLLLCAFAVTISIQVNAQLFTQNFEGSTVLTDYYNASPGVNQFTTIKTNDDLSAGVTNGKLRFSRLTNAGNGGFSRNVDFNPAPLIMQFKFEIEISGNTASQTTAAVIQIGSDFGNGVSTAENNGNTHSKFSINFDEAAGKFSLKDNTSGGLETSTYTGRQTITWFINNSDSQFNYTGPDGSVETLAADTWDLWIGTSKELNDRNAVTSTQELKNFKFVFTKGTGIIDIDNITITDFTVLPVNLTAFTAELKNGTALLRWSTASEENNSHFNVYRSVDGRDFEKITSVSGFGNSAAPHLYNCYDEEPKPGTNYYRLEQEDFDGKITVLGLTSLKNEAPLQIELLSMNQQEVQFSIYSPKALPAELTLRNMSGQSVVQLDLKLQEGYNQAVIPLRGRSRGLHIVNLKTNTGIVSQKLLW